MVVRESPHTSTMGASYEVVRDERRVTRPMIPVVLPLALLFWIAAACMYSSGDSLDPGGLRLVAIGSCTGACVALGLCSILRTPFILASFAFVLLGITCGATGGFGYLQDSEAALGEELRHFELTGDPSRSEYGWTVNAKGSPTASGPAYRVILYLDNGEDLYQGGRLISSGRIEAPKEDQTRHYRDRGIVGTISLHEVETVPLDPVRATIYAMRTRAIEGFGAYGGESGSLMQALVCGYRPQLVESGRYERFKTCGLAHIVAVSGAHLSIVVSLFSVLLAGLRTPRGIRIAASALFILFYLVFAGIPISAVRAAIMVVLGLLAPLFKRRASPLTALALCIMILIAADPSCALSASFFLTVGSTLGIVLFASLIESWFSFSHPLCKDFIGEPLALTASSNIATMPYCIAVFSQLPLLGPIANILATPFFGAGCAAGLLAAIISFLVPASAPFVMGVASSSVLPLDGVAGILSSIPYAAVAFSAPLLSMLMLSGFIGVLLWMTWPRFNLVAAGSISLGILAFILVALLAPWSTGGTHLDMLDVGQGDSFLLRSQGETLLIDTGNRDSSLREALAEEHVVKLDSVLITHPDDDHCGSLSSLSSYVEMDRILVAKDLLSCACGKCEALRKEATELVGAENVIGLSFGDSFTVGSFECLVVWPFSFEEEGGNADSVCLRIGVDVDGDGNDEHRILMTGDAECEELERMAEAGCLGDVDVLKVGHHGSRVALDEDVVGILDPEISLIGVGESNRYGHPSQESISLLEGIGSRILRSDEDGSVRILFEKDGLRVSPLS